MELLETGQRFEDYNKLLQIALKKIRYSGILETNAGLKKQTDQLFEEHMKNVEQMNNFSNSQQQIRELLLTSKSSFFNLKPIYQELVRSQFIKKIIYETQFAPQTYNLIEENEKKLKAKHQYRLDGPHISENLLKWVEKQIQVLNCMRNALLQELYTISCDDKNQYFYEKKKFQDEIVEIELLIVENQKLQGNLKSEIFVQSANQYKQLLPEVSVKAAQDLIFSDITQNQNDNFGYLKEDVIETLFNQKCNNRLIKRNLQKLRLYNQQLPHILRVEELKNYSIADLDFFQFLEVRKSNYIQENHLTEVYQYPDTLEKLKILLSQQSRIFHIKEDVNIDQGAFLLFQIDQFFEKHNDELANHFLNFQPYDDQINNQIATQSSSQQFQMGAQIAEKEKLAKKQIRIRKCTHWLDNIRIKPEINLSIEQDKTLVTQNIVLEKYRDSFVVSWIKSLIVIDKHANSQKLEEMAYITTHRMNPLGNTAIYNEFVHRLFKLRFLKARENVIKILLYLNAARVIQQNLNTHFIELSQTQIHTNFKGVIKIQNKFQKNEDGQDTFITKNVLPPIQDIQSIFNPDPEYEQYQHFNMIRETNPTQKVLQEDIQVPSFEFDEQDNNQKNHRDLFEEAELPDTPQKEKLTQTREKESEQDNNNLFFSQQNFEEHGDYLYAVDWNGKKILYDSVFQDFDQLGKEIQKTASLYIQMNGTQESLSDILNNVAAKRLKDDLIFRQALCEDLLFYESELFKNQISLSRKYFQVLKMMFDPDLKKKFIQFIVNTISLRPRLNLYQQQEMRESYFYEIEILKYLNDIVDELIRCKISQESFSKSEQLYRKVIHLIQKQGSGVATEFQELQNSKGFYQAKIVAKILLEVDTNLALIRKNRIPAQSQGCNGEHDLFEIFFYEINYLKNFLDSTKQILLQGLDFSSLFKQFRWLESDPNINIIDPYRSCKGQIVKFCQDQHAQIIDPIQRDVFTQSLRVFEEKDLIDSMKEQKDLSFNLWSIMEVARMRERTFESIYTLSILIKTFKEQISQLISDDLLNIFNFMLQEMDVQKVEVHNWLQYYLDRRGLLKLSQDLNVINIWMLPTINRQMFVQAGTLAKSLETLCSLVQNQVLVNNFMFDELKLLTPDTRSQLNLHPTARDKHIKFSENEAYMFLRLSKGPLLLSDIFEIKEEICQLVFKNNSSSIKQEQDEALVKDAEKIDDVTGESKQIGANYSQIEQRWIVITQFSQKYTGSVEMLRSARSNHDSTAGNKISPPNYLDVMRHMKGRGYTMQDVQKFSRLTNNFHSLQVQTILLKNLLEEFALKLPFHDGDIFTLPFRTVERLSYPFTVINALHALRENQDLKEDRFPVTYILNTMKLESIDSQIFTGFFDISGIASNLFCIPTIEQIIRYSSEEMSKNSSTISQQFEANTQIAYDAQLKKEYKIENYFYQDWMKSHANIFFGDEELLQRDQPEKINEYGGYSIGPIYRERNIYQINEFPLFKKSPVYYMSRGLSFLLNLVYSFYFQYALQSKNKDLFLLLTGKLSSKSIEKNNGRSQQEELGSLNTQNSEPQNDQKKQEQTIDNRRVEVKVRIDMQQMQKECQDIKQKIQSVKDNIKIRNINEGIVVLLEQMQNRHFSLILSGMMESLNFSRKSLANKDGKGNSKTRNQTKNQINVLREFLSNMHFRNSSTLQPYGFKGGMALSQISDAQKREAKLRFEEMNAIPKPSRICEFFQEGATYEEFSDLMKIMKRVIFFQEETSFASESAISKNICSNNISFYSQHLSLLPDFLSYGILRLTDLQKQEIYMSLNSKKFQFEKILTNRYIFPQDNLYKYERNYNQLIKYDIRCMVMKELLLCIRYQILPFSPVPHSMIVDGQDPIERMIQNSVYSLNSRLQLLSANQKRKNSLKIDATKTNSSISGNQSPNSLQKSVNGALQVIAPQHDDQELVGRMFVYAFELEQSLLLEGKYFYSQYLVQVNNLAFEPGFNVLTSRKNHQDIVGSMNKRRQLQLIEREQQSQSVAIRSATKHLSINMPRTPFAVSMMRSPANTALAKLQVKESLISDDGKFFNRFVSESNMIQSEILNEFSKFRSRLGKNSSIIESLNQGRVLCVPIDFLEISYHEMCDAVLQMSNKSVIDQMRVFDKQNKFLQNEIQQKMHEIEKIKGQYENVTGQIEIILESRMTEKQIQLVFQRDYLEKAVNALVQENETQQKELQIQFRDEYIDQLRIKDIAITEMKEKYEEFKSGVNIDVAEYVDFMKKQRGLQVKDQLVTVFQSMNYQTPSMEAMTKITGQYSFDNQAQVKGVNHHDSKGNGILKNKNNNQEHSIMITGDHPLDEQQIDQILNSKSKALKKLLESFSKLRAMKNYKEVLLKEKYVKRIQELETLTSQKQGPWKRITELQSQVEELQQETNDQKAFISQLEQQIIILQRDSKKTSVEQIHLIRSNSARKIQINQLKHSIVNIQKNLMDSMNIHHPTSPSNHQLSYSKSYNPQQQTAQNENETSLLSNNQHQGNPSQNLSDSRIIREGRIVRPSTAHLTAGQSHNIKESSGGKQQIFDQILDQQEIESQKLGRFTTNFGGGTTTENNNFFDNMSSVASQFEAFSSNKMSQTQSDYSTINNNFYNNYAAINGQFIEGSAQGHYKLLTAQNERNDDDAAGLGPSERERDQFKKSPSEANIARRASEDHIPQTQKTSLHNNQNTLMQQNVSKTLSGMLRPVSGSQFTNNAISKEKNSSSSGIPLFSSSHGQTTYETKTFQDIHSDSLQGLSVQGETFYLNSKNYESTSSGVNIQKQFQSKQQKEDFPINTVNSNANFQFEKPKLDQFHLLLGNQYK